MAWIQSSSLVGGQWMLESVGIRKTESPVLDP